MTLRGDAFERFIDTSLGVARGVDVSLVADRGVDISLGLLAASLRGVRKLTDPLLDWSESRDWNCCGEPPDG